MPGTTLDPALSIAQKIRTNIEALKISHQYSDVIPYVTLSLGVSSIVPGMDDGPIKLIKQADIALYSAKNNGRNQVCPYHKGLSSMAYVNQGG